MPDDLVKAILTTKEKNYAEIGIEWCAHQSQELKKAGVPCLHYYTMGDSDTIKKIVEQV